VSATSEQYEFKNPIACYIDTEQKRRLFLHQVFTGLPFRGIFPYPFQGRVLTKHDLILIANFFSPCEVWETASFTLLKPIRTEVSPTCVEWLPQSKTADSPSDQLVISLADSTGSMIVVGNEHSGFIHFS